jgi:hypothetical protein
MMATRLGFLLPLRMFEYLDFEQKTGFVRRCMLEKNIIEIYRYLVIQNEWLMTRPQA